MPSMTTQQSELLSSTTVPMNTSSSIIQPSAPAVTLLESSSIGMPSTKLSIVAPSAVSSENVAVQSTSLVPTTVSTAVNAAFKSTSLVPESTSVPTVKGNDGTCNFNAKSYYSFRFEC